MNTTKTLLAIALTLASATSAFAQEAMQDSPAQYTSQLSRVEVRQALAQAPRTDIAQYGDATQFAVPAGSMLSRAQVAAETMEALRLGVVSRHERNVFATAAELELIRQAGLKAVPMTVAAR